MAKIIRWEDFEYCEEIQDDCFYRAIDQACSSEDTIAMIRKTSVSSKLMLQIIETLLGYNCKIEIIV